MSTSVKVFEKLFSVFKCGPMNNKKRTVSVESLCEWDQLVAETLGFKIKRADAIRLKSKPKNLCRISKTFHYGMRPFKPSLSTIYEVSEEDEVDKTFQQEDNESLFDDEDDEDDIPYDSENEDEEAPESVRPLPRYKELHTYWEMSV